MVDSGGTSITQFTPMLWLVLSLLVAVPTLAILHAWIVDNTLGAAVAIAFIGIQGSGVMLLFKSRGTTAALCCGLLLLLACSVVPLLWGQVNKREIKRMDDEEINRLHRTLSFDPKNSSAYALLAQHLAKQKRYEEAISALETALSLSPEGPHSKRWHSQLKEVKQWQDGIDVYNFLVCNNCQRDIPKTSRKCPSCGALQNANVLDILTWAFQREQLFEAGKEAAVAGSIFIIAISALRMMSLEWQGCFIISTTIVGGVFFLRKLGGA